VIDARDAYSAYLLNELDDEIAKHVPSYKEYLEILKSIGNVQFTPQQFGKGWEGRPSLQGQDPSVALVELFEFSVIGYLKSGGGAAEVSTCGVT
jgi:hypothetical protein